MDGIEKLVLLSELSNSEYCQLNHGPNTIEKDYIAVDYLICPIGYKESENIQVVVKELTIPICQECVDGLNNDNWVLIYCLSCLNSQWIYKLLAKMKYPTNIVWLNGCPKCTKKFNGIYFNDEVNNVI